MLQKHQNPLTIKVEITRIPIKVAPIQQQIFSVLIIYQITILLIVILIIAHQTVAVTRAVQTATATADPQMEAVVINQCRLINSFSLGMGQINGSSSNKTLPFALAIYYLKSDKYST